MSAIEIPSVFQRAPDRIIDERGYFSEVYRLDQWRDTHFVQDNESLSLLPGTLRGLHFQAPPFAQAKLLRCLAGVAWNVAVDLRQGSPTYGRHATTLMDPETGLMTFVPAGFAQGFITLVPNTLVQWKVSARHAPDLAFGLAWDDPDLDINWPVSAPILSQRDRSHPRLKNLPAYFEGTPPA